MGIVWDSQSMQWLALRGAVTIGPFSFIVFIC